MSFGISNCKGIDEALLMIKLLYKQLHDKNTSGNLEVQTINVTFSIMVLFILSATAICWGVLGSFSYGKCMLPTILLKFTRGVLPTIVRLKSLQWHAYIPLYRSMKVLKLLKDLNFFF